MQYLIKIKTQSLVKCDFNMRGNIILLFNKLEAKAKNDIGNPYQKKRNTDYLVFHK